MYTRYENHTEEMLMREAYALQDACNLSGVLHSFIHALERLRALGITSTDALNTHPVSVLFADKVRDLTAPNGEAVYAAYEAIRRAGALG